MTNKPQITIDEAVRQVVAEMEGPLPMREFIERVLAIRPSDAKSRDASIRNAIRWSARRTWVRISTDTIAPKRTVMRGVRFRIAPSRLEVKHGALLTTPTLDVFLNPLMALENARLVDASGSLLPTRVIAVKQEFKSPLGPTSYEVPAFELADWFRATRLRHGDSVLVTIEDWENGSFRLEHEPSNRRRFDEIDRKNREMTDLIFSRLEAAQSEDLDADEAVAAAYAEMSDPRGYPGDHWLDVIERDKRMSWDGWRIRYAEDRTPMQAIMGGEWRPSEVRFTPAQGRQVYRFKAILTYRPDLWRRIEIQGKHTLADFDDTLRDAFEHDFSDHLGGFWKRIRRGTGRRFRDVHLGDVEPFGGGEGADLRVAGLGLNRGDELKYVYDLGDWIEHRLTLEELGEPEEGVKYPRITAQNKPNYRYCESCQANGRQTVATWQCYDCSSREDREVLVCKECLYAHHEDHYADEILY